MGRGGLVARLDDRLVRAGRPRGTGDRLVGEFFVIGSIIVVHLVEAWVWSMPAACHLVMLSLLVSMIICSMVLLLGDLPILRKLLSALTKNFWHRVFSKLERAFGDEGSAEVKPKGGHGRKSGR